MASQDVPPGHMPPKTHARRARGPDKRADRGEGEGLAANYTIDPSVQFTYCLCWELDYHQQLNPSLWKSILGPEGQRSSMGAGMTSWVHSSHQMGCRQTRQDPGAIAGDIQ